MIDFTDFEMIQFPDDLDRELAGQSDRGLAVLGSAGLEYLLEQLLSSHIVEGSSIQKELFQGNGPLSSFSSRISICFSMGLISVDEHSELQLVRRIRNSLTHNVSKASFTSQSNRDLCRNLALGEKLFAPSVIPLVDLPSGQRGIPRDKRDYPTLSADELTLPNKEEPRVRFAASIHVLTRVLAARAALAERRNSPEEFGSPEEPLAIPMDRLRARYRELDDMKRRVLAARDEALAKGEPINDELRDLIADTAGDELSNRQIAMMFAMSDYSNEVIRESRRVHFGPAN